jgi:hypothetical protein
MPVADSDFNNLHRSTAHEPERKLLAAILAQVVSDAKSRGKHHHEARHWLERSRGVEELAGLLNMDPDYLRRELQIAAGILDETPRLGERLGPVPERVRMSPQYDEKPPGERRHVNFNCSRFSHRTRGTHMHFSTASHAGPLRAAVHEAGHCLVAAHASMAITTVKIDGVLSCTQVHLPMEPKDLLAAYAASPIRSMAALGKVLGVLAAGALALGEQPSGGDAGDIGLWYHAYCGCPGLGGSDGFLRVYKASVQTVSDFFHRGRTRENLHRLAEALERRGTLHEHALATLMDQLGCLSLEPVEWRTVLPPVGPGGRVRQGIPTVHPSDDSDREAFFTPERREEHLKAAEFWRDYMRSQR